MSIARIGSFTLLSPNRSFDLSNILHVPRISHNFLSVYQFSCDNGVYFGFYHSFFVVKGRRTREVLLCGQSSLGLYHLPISSQFASKAIFGSALIGERASVDEWHNRLGHRSMRLVRRILS